MEMTWPGLRSLLEAFGRLDKPREGKGMGKEAVKPATQPNGAYGRNVEEQDAIAAAILKAAVKGKDGLLHYRAEAFDALQKR